MTKARHAIELTGIVILLLGLILVNFFAGFFNQFFPTLPTWLIPALSGVLILFISKYIWYAIRQEDMMKYEFLAIVNHKFRTPLTGAKWALKELKKMPENAAREERELAVDNILSANERLLGIVDALAGLTTVDRRASYEFTSVSFYEMIEDALIKFREHIIRKNIKMEIKISHETPLVVADKKKIQFVVEILMENAILYTPQDGAIIIWSERDGKWLTFSIRDTGIGLSRKSKKNLFKRFYRSPEAKKRHTEGMGLGLSVAKKIVSRHRGALWAESKGINMGATFHLRLPVSKK